jgi:hypothetical protein
LYATMRLVAEYRQLANDYRRLAALLTKTADKQALELFAIGWDKIADNREAMLRNQERAEPTDQSKYSARELNSP